jgi:hypothetical protein
MTEMRKMADDSKGTQLALLLELLRIDITNEHIKKVVDHLGEAVPFLLMLDRDMRVLETCSLFLEKQPIPLTRVNLGKIQSDHQDYLE